MRFYTSLLVFFIMIFNYFLYIFFTALYSKHMLVFLNNIGTGIKILLSLVFDFLEVCLEGGGGLYDGELRLFNVAR